MSTIADIVKEGKEESLRLDIYFYEQELKSVKSNEERDTLLEKIRNVEKLLIGLKD